MRKKIADILFLAGFGLILLGLWMVHPVVAILAGGAGLMGSGYLIAAADRRANAGR